MGKGKIGKRGNGKMGKGKMGESGKILGRLEWEIETWKMGNIKIWEMGK